MIWFAVAVFVIIAFSIGFIVGLALATAGKEDAVDDAFKEGRRLGETGELRAVERRAA